MTATKVGFVSGAGSIVVQVVFERQPANRKETAMTEDLPGQAGAEVAGEFITNSDLETFELGRRVGEALSGRAIFLLHGDLGAGKTVFTKGLAAGLGIDPIDVTSPSFTLVNIHEGCLRLYHVDLYRIESSSRRDLGLEEMFEANAVTVIEWAERLLTAPDGAIEVNIEYVRIPSAG
jgi:tRNA threonylcarbamoyladenosine biosynthesis protein TsaE